MPLHKCPSPEDIKKTRLKLGLTQAEAAALLYRSTFRPWAKWESGEVKLNYALWELFLLKTRLLSLDDL